MPFFYLEPKNGDTSDPSWEASYLREGCWTEAVTEELARRRIESASLKMVTRKQHEPMKTFSRGYSPISRIAGQTIRPEIFRQERS
jgi:hypothetical protein